MRTRFISIATGVVLAGTVFLTACGGEATGTPETDGARLARIDALYQEYRADFSGVNEVTPQGLLDLQSTENTVLVDVRTPEEQAVSMLPGALTMDAFEAARNAYEHYTVVTYCTIGARSGAYADTLRKEGVEVFNLKGSILAWTHAGLPLINAKGQDTRRVHTFGSKWNLAAKGYEATW